MQPSSGSFEDLQSSRWQPNKQFCVSLWLPDKFCALGFDCVRFSQTIIYILCTVFFSYFLLQTVLYFSSGSLLVCASSRARKSPLASLRAEVEQAVSGVTGTKLCHNTAEV